MKLVENCWQTAGAKRKSVETGLEDGVCHGPLTFVNQDLSTISSIRTIKAVEPIAVAKI